MDPTNPVLYVLMALVAGLGAFGQWLGKFIIDYWTNKQKKDAINETSIIAIMQAQITDMKATIHQNEEDIRKLIRQELELRGDNAAMKIEIVYLKRELEDVKSSTNGSKIFYPEGIKK